VITTMDLTQCEQNEDFLDKYNYIDVQEDDHYMGLFVPEKYAKEVKAFVEKCKKREDEIR